MALILMKYSVRIEFVRTESVGESYYQCVKVIKKVTLVSRRAMIPKNNCWQLLMGRGLLNFQPLYTLGDVLWYLQWQGLRGPKSSKSYSPEFKRCLRLPV